MTTLLLLHVFGAVLFIGNIITVAFWKVRADAKKDPLIIHHTAKNIMLADVVFTIPGLILIIVSGALMASQANIPMHGLNWLSVSLLLFALTGVVWLAILIPLQRAMIRHSAACIESGHISDAYSRSSRMWAFFGTIATLLPVIILYLMVTKSF